MELLLTGKLSSISEGFCNTLCEQHKVVLASEDIDNDNVGKASIPFNIQPKGEDFSRLLKSYDFGAVIFFSSAAEGIRESSGELTKLENVLKSCSEHDIEKVIYISSTSVYAGAFEADEKTEVQLTDSFSVELTACEQLCDFYRVNEGLKILVLHVPYLYGYGESSSAVAELVNFAVDNSFVRFPGSSEQICEFLSQEDFSILLLRIFDDWPSVSVMNVSGGCSCSFSGLGLEFIKLIPTLKISYSAENNSLPVPIKSDLPRSEYDWVATLNIADELPRLIREYTKRHTPDKRSVKNRIETFIIKNKPFIILCELIIGFIITELLNNLSSVMVQFKYVDFRLLFVVVMATIHGLSTGMIAAGLASISIIIGYSQLNVGWQMVLYNIDNWLPFACYFLIASIAGYTRDKHRDELFFLENENRTLEERYFFLNELYGEALKNKSEFKSQILSYNGSFGRIYEVARRLNSLLPEVIFKEALEALEDLLINQSISIYTVSGNSGYARLAVCSQKIAQKTPKSIKLEDYSVMIDDLEESDVWSNKEQYAGYPDYCSAIFRNKKPVVFILIHKVKFEQMAMHFQNLIRVLCGLIQVSLIRAYEYNERLEKEKYLPGTRIINKENFIQLFEATQAMADKEIAEYSVLHILCGIDEREKISETITNTLRVTDYIGIGKDNELYVILSQTGRMNIEIISHKLHGAGVAFEVTDNIGNIGGAIIK